MIKPKSKTAKKVAKRAEASAMPSKPEPSHALLTALAAVEAMGKVRH